MATIDIHTTTDDVVFSPPAERRALLNVASALLPGALVLANADARREALVFLLGHITECLLKSIALKQGTNSKELHNPSVRHNLVELWRFAAIQCMQLQTATPPWVEALDKFHNHPYVSRYMYDSRYKKGVSAYSLPATDSILEGVIFLHAQATKLV